MDMVERACIAYNQILLNQPEDQRDQTLAMKAAIRAMLEGREPVAWRYSRQSHQSTLITRVVVMERDADRVVLGYTETPLYDLSAIKEAIQ